MEEFFNSFDGYFGVLSVLEILVKLFTLLFMHYSAKSRNKKLKGSWYVCGVLFSFWTLVVFLIRRSDFPGEEAKHCKLCGEIYLKEAEHCPKCSVELAESDKAEKQKQKKISRIFFALLVVTSVTSTVFSFAFGEDAVEELLGEEWFDEEMLDESSRIAVDGVFYDKTGNSYENENDVLLYDEEGRIYTYTLETTQNEHDLFPYEEEYYVRDDGKKYLAYDCYVTQDGWFYCDKACELEMYYVDLSTLSKEELDAYYEENVEMAERDYKYYDYPYTDEEGNLYYDANEASWNEKGELISAENDPT
ncbi:MAG: hypothetical protein IJN38_02375 [Clostridia bacterium]|nr:hypothetical protein [Clostridia bacterium]